eukprot:TRINITY_DN2087_c1_g1_i5.p1 TRINITY_DN2087_c1_g1~~TRINITY_DN2087_c1_g1_i5.p1  ORF type:complete len:381 (-),score=11.93 TRINITY_DN2087_c1_g1_i5:1104-2246(-)
MGNRKMFEFTFAVTFGLFVIELGISDVRAEHGIRFEQDHSYKKNESKCDPVRNYGCEKFIKEDVPSPLEPGHTCKDYTKKDRGQQSHILRLLTPSWMEKRTVGNYYKRKYNDFFYVNGSQPGQEFLLCAMPKNGVTRTKVLIMRIIGAKGDVHYGAKYQYVHDLSDDERQRVLTDPQIPRIKLVRNPYIRAISMYKDKIINENSFKDGYYVGWHMKFKYLPSFDQFVQQLHSNYQQRRFINEHFATQYEHCWENVGLNFDYVLKIEQMNSWYPCFVRDLNLWQYVMHGWNDWDHCYLSTDDVPCNGPHQNNHGKLIYSQGQKDGISPKHNRNSTQYFNKIYANETTAKLVTEVYLNDIVRYNYPFWPEMVWSKLQNDTKQ